MNRNELHEKFQRIYDDLNAEQKDAVDSIYGPVLVIAGPGTGKTQILSARIGKILLVTDYLPDNILCLTYTDAGRVAMRKRLQEMIGADAYRVNIHTFHSFCNQIIQENTTLFNKNALDPVSDLERIDFLKQIIDDFPKDNPLKRYRGDVYYEMKSLSSFISTMKKEGWTSSFIRDKVDDYLRSLPERDEFIYKRSGKGYKQGDLKIAAIEAVKEAMERLCAAVEAFDAYQQLMNTRNRYDFDDMINWVLEALQKNESLLADLHERFQFLLVDEFQDTSGTQNMLLELLCKDVEQPNIFVVGDDDQSIFRFQGANVENITAYKNRYEAELKRVVLKNNYRSTQSILDASQAVIENNQERLSGTESDIWKDLIASHPTRRILDHMPQLHLFENPFQEMVGVTEEIHGLLENGISPHQIAVLYKENKMGEELMKFFKQKDIAYYSKVREDLFKLPLSKKIITILRYIAKEIYIPYSGDELLFEILHFDLYHIPPIDIAKASVAVADFRKEKTSLRRYFQEWIRTKNRTLFEAAPHEGLVHISTHLEKWISESFNITIIQLVENVMQEGGFLKEALQSDDKRWNLEVLRSLMNFVKEEIQRHPSYSLQNLLDVIDLMESQDVGIPLYRVFGQEAGVNLTTVHGAKGLEFLYVFLIQSNSNFWEGKKNRSSQFKLPDNIFQTLHTDQGEAKVEELRRLFFVALTRAEENLIISWSKTDGKQKPLEPTQFISEITDKISLHRRQQVLSEETVNEYLEISLLKQSKPSIAESENEFINALLQRFEMNATALNNYLKCPLQFYYQSLIRVPSGKHESMEFGSAVHHALEKLFTKMQENGKVFPSLDIFIDDFMWFMKKHKESFTREGFARRIEYGQMVLSDLYNHNMERWNTRVSVERTIKGVVVDGVPIKGQIDKMEFDGHHVVVVDYKTGKPENAKEKTKPPTAKDPNGGDYWRQGVFYKLLIDHWKTNDYVVTKSSFQMVEPNKKKEYQVFDIIPSEDDLNTVRNQITDTWKRIHNHEFYTGCGKEDCHWCNFVKENKQYVRMEKVDEEGWETEETD